MSVLRRLVNVAYGKVRVWQRGDPFDAAADPADAAAAEADAHERAERVRAVRAVDDALREAVHSEARPGARDPETDRETEPAPVVASEGPRVRRL